MSKPLDDRGSGLPGTTLKCVCLIALCLLALVLDGCTGNVHTSFLDPQGPVADVQRWHFYWVLGIMAVLVAGPIFLALPFFLWRYRYGNKHSRYTPKWEFSRWLEIFSWSGPIIIVMVLGFFVWRDSHKLDPYKPLASDQPALRVQVVGYDWKWLFIYPDQGIATVGKLVMPAKRPVSLQLTSATVMQSFFIPALGSQIYAMGGMVTQLNLQADKPGRFLGENTMYNGKGFRSQRFVAVATSPSDFSKWVASVHARGTSLDAHTLKIIARRSTRAQLVSALPHADSKNDVIYLTNVQPHLFAAVVRATKTGVPPSEILAATSYKPEHVAAATVIPAGKKTP